MRSVFFGLLLLSLFISANAQKSIAVVPKVDERIELTSLVARLADYREYGDQAFKSYSDDVEKHFAKYKNHAATGFARELRQRQNIGFDAVPNFAVRLEKPPSLKSRV